jgi:hypothetical protein
LVVIWYIFHRLGMSYKENMATLTRAMTFVSFHVVWHNVTHLGLILTLVARYNTAQSIFLKLRDVCDACLVEGHPFLDDVSGLGGVVDPGSAVARCHPSSKVLSQSPLVFLYGFINGVYSFSARRTLFEILGSFNSNLQTIKLSRSAFLWKKHTIPRAIRPNLT